ncbi:MAG: thiolase family protein, partial [Leptospiraceae bacterium]|nr:thiolase family protein [Leptospiraceae bacterium]
GQESMTNFNYYIDGAKKVSKTASLDKLMKVWDQIPQMEEVKVVDSVMEGLTDPVRNAMMIETGEVVAQKLGLTKSDLDKYAYGSYKRAFDAIEAGKYDPYYVPVQHAKGTLDKDEYIMSKTGFVQKPERFEKASAVYEMIEGGIKGFYDKYSEWIGRPFKEGETRGAVTLFNACPQSDGAAACFLTTESKAKELGLEIQAYVKGWANAGVDPVYMGLGIAYSMKKALEVTGLKWDDIGTFEVHEAFAATALGSMIVVRDEFGYDLPARLEKGDVNPHGGTLALGHPLGATGLRVLINQIIALKNSDARYSMGAICAGGGVGGALILEKA